MELEEFIEENLENVSEWVFSCAQYALRNFTHEVELHKVKNKKYRGIKFRGKKPRTPNGLPAYPSRSLIRRHEEILQRHKLRLTAWESLPERPEDYYIEVPVDIDDDDTLHDGRTVDKDYRDENGSFFVDLRLRWFEGELFNYSGDPQYDQDHRGYWSSSSVEWCATKKQSREIAKDMLTDLFNNIPEGEEDENN